MMPPAALAKCSGTVPLRLFRPPNSFLRAPTPRSFLRYTFLAIAAATAVKEFKTWKLSLAPAKGRLPYLKLLGKVAELFGDCA